MQKILAKIIQLNFQLMWTSGLTPLFIFFSTLGPNNFQTVIDSEKCSISTQNFGKKYIYPENFSSVSQIIKIKFQAKYKKIKIFLLAFLKFSLFLFLLTAPFLLVNAHHCVSNLDAP